MVNWNRFFPPLRHRPNANYLDNHPTVHEGQPPAQVSEEQVTSAFYEKKTTVF